jgi:hypothetical protein
MSPLRKQKVRGTWPVICILLFFALVPAAKASLIVPRSIEDMAHDAHFIFAGTVSGVSSQWNSQHTMIVTKVGFQDISAVKGTARDHVELVVAGGKVGEDEEAREGQPSFAPGTRFILFCASDTDLGSERNYYIPILGLYDGSFSVGSSFRTGLKVVHDSEGREVVDIKDGRLVVAAEEENRPAKRPTSADIESDAGRVNYGLSDSIHEREIARRQPRAPRDDPRKITRARPTPKEAGGERRTVDWVEGSQKIRLGHGPVISIVSAEEDPGTRMSETQFLKRIQLLAAR